MNWRTAMALIAVGLLLMALLNVVLAVALDTDGWRIVNGVVAVVCLIWASRITRRFLL
jgi:hypothetical protein